MHYLCVISLLICGATGFLYNNYNINDLLKNLDTTPQALNLVEEKWIEQPLDHFDKNEKRTFKMRYFQNLELWKPNAPIYIFLGGRADQEPFWVANLDDILMIQIARETNGALFAAEHRYAGKSLPDIPNDNIIEYSKYLRISQAMADVANLIQTLKSDPKYKSSKVVLIGGDYQGNHAAWMRKEYPDLVDAAVAASAPVLAKKDYHEFDDIISDDLDKYGTKDCIAKFTKSRERWEEQMRTPEGREKYKKDTNICPESDLTLLENQQWLFYTSFACLKFDCINGNIPNIKTECEWRLGCSRHLLDNLDEMRCYDLNFTKIAKDQTKGYLAPFLQQYCTEYGHLDTTSPQKEPFIKWVPLDFKLKFCKPFLDGDTEKIMDEGIARTNQMWGGSKPNVTKVVFTHGDMDPWHLLGVLQDLGPDAPSILNNGTGHCGVLAVQDGEPKEMRETRKRVKDLIKKWIAE